MDKTEVSKTINALSLACLIGHFIFDMQWLIVIAAVLLTLNAAESRLAVLIARGWMKFGMYMGKVLSALILAILFYLFLLPLAFAFRLFNKKAVNHFTTDQKPTCFEDVNRTYSKELFEKLW
jgi:predicted membrane protein